MKTAREQSALAEQARRLAEQFRDVYQTAQADGRFPVEVRGAAYTQSQVHSQVSMLLAQVDELMTGNRQTIDANPVATVRELLARTPAKQEGLATDRKVEEFLTAKPEQADTVETIIDLFDTSVIEPTTQQSPAQFDSKDKPRTGKQSKPVRTKPIFQQS